MSASRIFETALELAKINLFYNVSWSSGPGYLDFAVSGENAPLLAAGRTAKSADPDGRRILLIGTPGLGNLVIFDRYGVNNENFGNTFLFNSSKHFEKNILPDVTTLGESEMIYLAIDSTENIGHRLKNLFSVLTI